MHPSDAGNVLRKKTPAAVLAAAVKESSLVGGTDNVLRTKTMLSYLLISHPVSYLRLEWVKSDMDSGSRGSPY